jgi:2-phospho-L-lactate guanylyltransferase (CobY/MobA/RfbA family)
MLSIENWKSSSISSLRLTLNSDTTNNYIPTSMDLAALSNQLIMSSSKATTDGGYGSIFIPTAGTGTQTKMVINGNFGGTYNSTSTISSIQIFPSAGSFNTGSYYIWSQS